MSTRSVIARKTGPTTWRGVYHDSDGYPRQGLGQFLIEGLVHGHFKQAGLKVMLDFLIDAHPAGWSCIVGADFKLKPGYSDTSKGYPSVRRSHFPDGDAGEAAYDAAWKTAYEKYHKLPRIRRPHCFCHGERHEEPNTFTQEHLPPFINGDDWTNIEWLYLFDEQANTLQIFDVRANDKSQPMCEAGLVRLPGNLEAPASDDPAKIDWEHIECGADLSRCSHYAWVHFPEAKDNRLGTAKYLGREPMEMNDCVAVLINGKRYAWSGSGHNSKYNFSLPGVPYKHFPPGLWIATVRGSNGKGFETPVARVTKSGYIPYPGVTWVFPPTKINPEESHCPADTLFSVPQTLSQETA